MDDATSPAAAPPSAKRPRVGRPHADILGPIEAATNASGRGKHLRAVLLHAGQTRREGEALADVLAGQARDVAGNYASDAATVLEVVFEW